MTTNKTEESAQKNRLVIISGGSRGIGKAFGDYFNQRANTTVIRLARSNREGLTQLDLSDELKARAFVDGLDLGRREYLTYIHSIGIDKFEPNGGPQIDQDRDGIDDEVYSSNVATFMNLAEPLIAKLRITNTPVTIVNIGSVSDVFAVPYWQSFSKAKNLVRQYLKSLNLENVKGLFLNVSSTLDEDGHKYGRVNADAKYWQTSRELVEKSVKALDLIEHIDTPYAEFDFYKPDPRFKPDYFTNLPKLFASWQRDMGFAGKEVPHGIRI